MLNLGIGCFLQRDTGFSSDWMYETSFSAGRLPHFLIFLPVMQPVKGVSFPSHMVGSGVVVLAFGPVVSPCFLNIRKCSKPIKGVHIGCCDIFLIFPRSFRGRSD